MFHEICGGGEPVRWGRTSCACGTRIEDLSALPDGNRQPPPEGGKHHSSQRITSITLLASLSNRLVAAESKAAVAPSAFREGEAL